MIRFKVTNILEDSLDSIPSPSLSVKTQAMGRKDCLSCKGKTFVNFPAHNLNFYWMWRWWDWIQATFYNLFYFNTLAEIISPNFGRQHNAPTTQHTYFKLDRQTHTEQISNLSAMTSSNQKIFCSLFEHDTFRTAHTRLNCCRD